MSQAARHAKQENAIAAEAAALLRQRQALAPKPMAVHVASAWGFTRWREISFSRLAFEGYLKAKR